MIICRRRLLAMFAAGALAACSSNHSPYPTPAPGIRTRWTRFTPRSGVFVDHGLWASILARHVFPRSDGVHLFSYGDVSPSDRKNLDSYILMLTGFEIANLSRREQYAYWLNLYNALVVRLVLSRYFILSLRDIGFGLGSIGMGPFDRKLIEIEGEPLSLSDIRNHILRPIFSDPRLHYGLSDAAIGSPNLPLRAFTGDLVDRMLDAAALDFVNHPRAVRWEARRLVLSELYLWYDEDFSDGSGDPLRHLSQYAAPDLLPKLSLNLKREHAFDWSLNDGTGIQR